MAPKLVALALLALYPHMSGRNRACVARQAPRISRQLAELTTPHLEGAEAPPTPLIAAIGFLESHLGCDAGEGGGWGAPVSRRQRHIAGTHHHAAVILERSWLICGRDWQRAVTRFHSGLCDRRWLRRTHPVYERTRWYVRTVFRLTSQIEAWQSQPTHSAVSESRHGN